MPVPRVGVVLPVRDGGKTLDRAIGSVLASHDVDLELLCVDDGSTDDTPRRLEAWRRLDGRVHVVTTPARGIVAALNSGIEQARAPLIARMDGDDEMHPERLAAQAALLEAHPELALVGCRVESFREGGLLEGYRLYCEWVNGLVTPEEIAREAFVECPIPHPSWMFRREAVRSLGGYVDRGWPEDLDLIYRLLERGYGIGKVPRILHRWRDHEGRLSRRDPRYGREAFLRAKAHYVGRVHPMKAAVIWGAGRTGRRLARLLGDSGTRVLAFVDIREDRAGGAWRGIPILSPRAVPERAAAWHDAGVRVLGAVASRGARREIRSFMVEAGLAEGRDFVMMA